MRSTARGPVRFSGRGGPHGVFTETNGSATNGMVSLHRIAAPLDCSKRFQQKE